MTGRPSHSLATRCLPAHRGAPAAARLSGRAGAECMSNARVRGHGGPRRTGRGSGALCCLAMLASPARDLGSPTARRLLLRITLDATRAWGASPGRLVPCLLTRTPGASDPTVPDRTLWPEHGMLAFQPSWLASAGRICRARRGNPCTLGSLAVASAEKRRRNSLQAVQQNRP